MNTVITEEREQLLLGLANQLGQAIAHESMVGHIDMSKTFFPAIRKPEEKVLETSVA